MFFGPSFYINTMNNLSGHGWDFVSANYNDSTGAHSTLTTVDWKMDQRNSKNISKIGACISVHKPQL